MSKPRWTEQQQSVIDSRKGNLLVAAAAGSGKTAVLVERIIQMITDPDNPINIDTLLIVTFTNAAALEMKERIYNAIEKILQNTVDEIPHLEKQLILLENASITTIHSFCLDVVEKYHFKINLSPDFKIGSEEEFHLLKKMALENTFETYYNEGNTDFLDFIKTYSNSKGDEPARQMVETLHKFVLASPEPDKWLDESAEMYNIDETFDFLSTEIGKYFISKIKIDLEGVKTTLNSIVDQTEGIIEVHSYHQRYTNEYFKVDGLINSLGGTWDEVKNKINSFEFEDFRKGIKKVPKTADESIKKLQKSSKDIRDNCKKIITKLNETIFYKTNQDIISEYKRLYPLMRQLSNITTSLINEYQESKKSRNIIDFNDIEHYALKILTNKNEHGDLIPSDVASAYSKKFEEIFIDEYQDSSLTQEVLLSSISKNDSNRFMVGDVKQSIYKFRQARPDIFIDKYNNYSTDTNELRKKILLDKNFRSRYEILEATNYIFEHIMSDNAGGLEYGDSEKLNLGGYFKEPNEPGVEVGGPTDIYLIDNKRASNNIELEENEESNEDAEELDKIQIEAKAIGDVIINLMSDKRNFQIIDKKSNNYRRLNFGDIVILLRSTSAWAEIIEKELRQYNIPVSIELSSGYLHSFEIECIMNILKLIKDKYDDISMIGTMRNPIFDFTDDDIIEIKSYEPNSSIIDNLESLHKSSNETLRSKINKFLTKINLYTDYSYNNLIRDTLLFIYKDSGIYLFMKALNNGEIRIKNLDLLVNRAQNFDSDGKTLYNFINYIDRIKEQGLDLNSAKPDNEENNSVRVMTIHKSKGLEFPVVICAGLGKKFNTQDLNNTTLYHPDYGYGAQIIDMDRHITYSSINKEAIKSKMINETLSEEIRILYVALTRPKEKLILIGSVDNLEKKAETWSQYLNEFNKLPEYAVLNATCYIDWIIPSVLKHNDVRETAKDLGIQHLLTTKHPSRWTCTLLSPYNGLQNNTVNNSVETNKEQKVNFISLIDKGLIKLYNTTEYKANILEKTNVTDLVHQDIKGEIYIPSFEEIKERDIGSLEKGSIIHDFMYRLNMNIIKAINDVAEQLETLILNGIFSDEEAKLIPVESIYKFVMSDLGKRIKNAKTIRKEQPISAMVSTNSTSEKGETLVKGIIDMFFEEEDGIIILDYKSDLRVSPEQLQSYTEQLKLYKQVLELSTGKKVKECYLCFLNKEENILI